MTANAFMYATVSLDYNKVMHILPEWYRVAIIVKHQKSTIYNHDVMLVHCWYIMIVMNF